MRPGSQDPACILYNASVRTMRSEDDLQDAIALQGERILEVGPADQLFHALPDAIRIDAGGATILPGFTDVHTHLEYFGEYVDGLNDVGSTDEMAAVLEAYLMSRDTSAWVFCKGRVPDRDLWPSRELLDSMSPDRPFIVSLGDSRSVVNSLALDRLDQSEIAAGRVILEPDRVAGRPSIVRLRSGVRLENVFVGGVPDDPLALESSLTSASRHLAARGITSVHNMIRNRRVVRAHQRLSTDDAMLVRAGLLLRCYESKIQLESLLELGIVQGFGDAWLKVQGIKISVDGYFPDGGACFSNDYCDEPGSRGELRVDKHDLVDHIVTAHEAGLRCCVHANGDHAVDLALDAFEAALSTHPTSDRRHRIEHAGNIYLTDEQIARLADLEVIAVPNPPFLGMRAHMMPKRLGKARSRTPVAVKRLLDGGVSVVAASDFPGLYPVDPLVGIQALVTRRGPSGDYHARDQAIPVWEALKLYTVNAAWASFEESERGTLAAGKLADLVVLEDDPCTAPAEEIAKIPILATYVGGRRVFEGSRSWPKDHAASLSRQ